MEEVIALFGEFGASVLQPGAVIGLAITVVLFILEVRWSRAHPPRNRRAEKAKALGHVVTARRVKYWDDGVSPDEKTTSQYHATYAYEVAGKQYQYKYLERAVPPVQIQLYYLDDPGRACRGTDNRSGRAHVFVLLFPILAGAAAAYRLGVR